jgi:hypothetical protein
MKTLIISILLFDLILIMLFGIKTFFITAFLGIGILYYIFKRDLKHPMNLRGN